MTAPRSGRPTMVAIAAATSLDQVTFELGDDGVGFVASEVSEGHGFANVADRVGAFGGTVDVASIPGQGTAVRGAVPSTA